MLHKAASPVRPFTPFGFGYDDGGLIAILPAFIASVCRFMLSDASQDLQQHEPHQQRAQLKSFELWAMTKVTGDGESNAVLLAAEYGPSGTQVYCWRMTSHTEQSMALYFLRISGMLREVHRSMPPNKCPAVSWDTFREVLSEVVAFLQSCRCKHDFSLPANVVTWHCWPEAQEELRIAFEKDSLHFRWLLNQTVHPVAAGRVIGWLWFL